MNILITGAAGYIGSVLTPLLLELGHHVIAVDLDLSSLVMCCESDRFEPVKTDIGADIMTGLLARADAVVHLAAIVGAKAVDENPQAAKQTMIGGVWTIIGGAKNKPIIYPNTDSNSHGHAKSLYAELKCIGEEDILNHGGVSLRLGSVFGPSPRMRHTTLLNFMVREAVTKGFLALSQPNAKRTLLHVEDCALAIIHALGHYEQMKGQAFDVAIPRAWTKLEICEAIARQFPSGRPLYSSAWVEGNGENKSETVYESSRFKYVIDESAYHDPDERDFEPDTSKLAKLGFRTMNGVEQGIRDLVRVYKCV